MAYLPEEDDEAKKQADGAANPMLAGFGVSNTGAPKPAPSSSTAGPQQPSSSFVPYAAYANANQGSAQKMAQGLASDVDKSAGGAQAGLDSERQQYVDKVHAGDPYYQSPSASLQNWGSLAAPSSPYAAPTSKKAGDLGSTVNKGLTADQSRAQAAKGYTGPASFDPSQGLRDRTTQASDQLANVGSDEGRQALLQQKYGAGGGYTAGESRLDAALAGSAGAGTFDALRAKYGDLVGKLGTADSEADSVAQSAKGGADAMSGLYNQQATDKDALAAKNASLNVPYGSDAWKAKFGTPLERFHGEHSDEELKKAQSFDQYTTRNAKDWIREGGRVTSPLDGALEAFGLPTILDTATDINESGSGPYIGAAGKVGDPSNRAIDAFDAIGNKATARAVYDSMSQAEVTALEKMPRAARIQWLKNRANQLGLNPDNTSDAGPAQGNDSRDGTDMGGAQAPRSID